MLHLNKCGVQTGNVVRVNTLGMNFMYMAKNIFQEFTARLMQFEQKGEKTGWTYIEVPADIAQALSPGNKKIFQVKGKIDDHVITGISLLPMGQGHFILPVNGTMRKAIRKKEGAMVAVSLLVDQKKYQLNEDLIACLQDAPEASAYFKTLPPSHQNYFSKWIDAAKTGVTKVKRISMAVTGLSKQMDYGTMMRFFKKSD